MPHPIIEYNAKGQLLHSNSNCRVEFPYAWDRFKGKNIRDIFGPVFFSKSQWNSKLYQKTFNVFFEKYEPGYINPTFKVKMPPHSPYTNVARHFGFDYQLYLYGIIFGARLIAVKDNKFFAYLMVSYNYYNRLPANYTRELWVMTDSEYKILGANMNFEIFCPASFSNQLIEGRHLKEVFAEGDWERYEKSCSLNINYLRNVSNNNQANWEEIENKPAFSNKNWVNVGEFSTKVKNVYMKRAFLLKKGINLQEFDCRMEFHLKVKKPWFNLFFNTSEKLESVGLGYSFVWMKMDLHCKKKGDFVESQKCGDAFPWASLFTLEITLGRIKLYTQEKTIMEYTDPLPILEEGNSNFGIFFPDNPFQDFRLFKRKTACNIEQINTNVCDVRFESNPNLIFEMNPFSMAYDFAPNGLKGFIFRDITGYRRVEKKSNLLETKTRALESENLTLKSQAQRKDTRFISNNPTMQRIMNTIKQIADTPANILLLGETGTGKNEIAKLVHQLSQRKNRAFVKVDCSALSPNLLESELFGHEKGAFTGAVKQRIGRFELAHSGTIFLDEIANIDTNLQAKLLNVLQDRTFTRVGGSKLISSDFRVVTATNQNLLTLMETNHFRNDLYYRLSGVVLSLPPLRDRREDVIMLANHFLKVKGKSYKKPDIHFHKTTVPYLLNYPWPGNIRELENIIETSLILCNEKAILPQHLTFTHQPTLKGLRPSSHLGLRSPERRPQHTIVYNNRQLPITNRQKKIMKMLERQKNLSLVEIKEKLRVANSTAYRDLLKLIRLKLVKPWGHGSRRRYLVRD